MSEPDAFRELIREVLTTAALEIFRRVEKTHAEYKEEISRSEVEKKRLQRLLDVVTQPEIKLRRLDVQHLSLLKTPQIKEEQELWTTVSETTNFIVTMECLNVKMCKLNGIQEIISERLTAAASDIFRAFEIAFAEYQGEISRSEEERKRLQRLLDVVTQPVIKLHRTDVQHLSLPEPPQIKEEQELWTSQEEEQLQGLKSETTDSIFTSLGVEHDSDQEGSSVCSHLVQAVKVENREGDSLPTNTTEEQIKAEPHVQDYAAPEPGSDSQSLSVVAPDCPAAQRLEEHGEVLPLQETINSTITQVHSAVPGEKVPQPSHKGVKVHRCQECGKRFSCKSNLVVHMRRHTGEKHFQCQECGKGFFERCKLVQHMKVHTGEKPYQCQECERRYSDRSQLVKHMTTHAGEKPFKCQECNRAFDQNQSLLRHKRTHTGEKPYQCQECQKRFYIRSQLVKHTRTHTGEKPYKCKEFDKTFTQRGSMVIHMSTHTGEKLIQCQICKKSFVSKGNLVRHMKRHIGEKRYQCQECGKGFFERCILVQHMKVHTGEKPYQCQECERRYSDRSQLVKHMKTHSGEKPFKCQECNKAFFLNQSLLRHMRTHTGERPYQCQECDKTFIQSGGMVSHMRIHTGEKPHQCQECNSKFSSNSQLNLHKRTHTGEKPYQCHNCNKAFVQIGGLYRHMRTQSGKNCISVKKILKSE